jgi:Ca2+-transporting ATPase
MGTVFGLVAALLAGFAAPLTAVQILFINFVMDGILAITLGVEPPEKGIMQRKPDQKQKES